ncbi:MAG: histidine kinase [Actinoallomurus sp.]
MVDTAPVTSGNTASVDATRPAAPGGWAGTGRRCRAVDPRTRPRSPQPRSTPRPRLTRPDEVFGKDRVPPGAAGGTRGPDTGGSLAVGFILRDADDRRFAALAEARTAERLRLARELHDFVAHHVTGIVVRAQAARVLAGRLDAAGPDGEVYRETEEAGSDALAAMRRPVGMLRTDAEPSPTASGVRAAVLDASSGYAGISTDLPEELDGLAPGPRSLTPSTGSSWRRSPMSAVTLRK